MESTLIKKFGTESPNGLNERTDELKKSITPIVVPYSKDSNSFCHATRKLANKYNVCKSKIITAHSRHKNLKDILAPSKLPDISK